MMQDWVDSSDDDPAIAKIEASAHTDESGIHSQHEAGLFRRFWNWFFPRVERGADMAEAFGDAIVAERDATARQTAEAAAEIAVQKEIAEAKAGTQRQMEVKYFIENIEAIENLHSPAGQTLAFAKLIEQNPGLSKQAEIIVALVSRLSLQRGLSITKVTDDEKIPLEIPDRKSVTVHGLRRNAQRLSCVSVGERSMASTWLAGAPIDCSDSRAIVESDQRRPRDTLEMSGDRFIQEVEDRNAVVRTSRDRGPNAF